MYRILDVLHLNVLCLYSFYYFIFILFLCFFSVFYLCAYFDFIILFMCLFYNFICAYFDFNILYYYFISVLILVQMFCLFCLRLEQCHTSVKVILAVLSLRTTRSHWKNYFTSLYDVNCTVSRKNASMMVLNTTFTGEKADCTN